MSNEYDCPNCSEPIEVPDFAVQITCLECQHDFLVEADADFEDGRWINNTQLVPVKPYVPTKS